MRWSLGFKFSLTLPLREMETSGFLRARDTDVAALFRSMPVILFISFAFNPFRPLKCSYFSSSTSLIFSMKFLMYSLFSKVMGFRELQFIDMYDYLVGQIWYYRHIYVHHVPFQISRILPYAYVMALHSHSITICHRNLIVTVWIQRVIRKLYLACVIVQDIH